MAWRGWTAAAVALSVIVAGIADGADCATLPRAHMQLRITISASPLGEPAATIRRIVTESWRPYGLTFDWLDDAVGGAEPGRVDAWIAAVRGGSVEYDGGDLGRVLFNKNVPRPLILISIDAVIAWVQRQQAARFQTYAVFPQPTLGETAALSARALGHVAAHELGHAVLGRRSHADSGLMAAVWKWDPLRAARLLKLNALPLDAANAARLKSRLAESSSCP
jgi:hypothetical protein